MINVKALPVMSAHFKEAYQALLKAAQSVTRVLQAHCAAVKTKQVLAALAQGSLKRELELLCNVKVMLSRTAAAPASGWATSSTRTRAARRWRAR